jgi:flagellar hook-basal body complex protein FliE
MPYVPGLGAIAPLPLEVARPAAAPAASFDAVVERLAPPQGRPGMEFPDIQPPARSIESPPIGRTVQVGPQAPGAVNDAGRLFRPLADFLGEVNARAVSAAELQERYAAGEDVELHDVMIAAEEASVAVQLTSQIRNRIIEAYQEVSRMQV